MVTGGASASSRRCASISVHVPPFPLVPTASDPVISKSLVLDRRASSVTENPPAMRRVFNESRRTLISVLPSDGAEHTPDAPIAQPGIRLIARADKCGAADERPTVHHVLGVRLV